MDLRKWFKYLGNNLISTSGIKIMSNHFNDRLSYLDLSNRKSIKGKNNIGSNGVKLLIKVEMPQLKFLTISNNF